MSSRQLRKLQQQKELQNSAARAQEEEESEEDSLYPAPSKTKASLFAALQEDESADEGEKNESGSSHDEVNAPGPGPGPAPAPGPATKAKKAKKKRKKKANKQKEEQIAEANNEEDEIEAALRDLKLKEPKGGATTHTKSEVEIQYDKVCALLGVQAQHLKVANEMRNLFGKTATENNDDAGGPVGRGGRRRQQRGQQQQVDLETALKGHHLPGKGLPEVTLRRNPFIQGKEDWPKATTGGLTMTMVEDHRKENGTVEFAFSHDRSYQSTQRLFQSFVEMGDPQNLIGLLVQNPYNISLLIQVSKIAKDQTDHALSSDLLERALFSFGRSASSLFSAQLAEGKARLDFHRPENRELWLAGYQYIKSLIMKGTYRTAFEWAKLLLSLNPEEDPYCMRLMIHHLALRAHQFNWLLDLGDPALDKTQIPMFTRESFSRYHTIPSLAFAALQIKDGSESRKYLTTSMQNLPWLFVAIFQELNLDAPKSIWGNQPRTDAERLFTQLYIQQTKDLWNTPEATSLLMEVAHTIPKVDTTSVDPVPNTCMDIDIVRFVYLDNTPTLMALVPSNLLHKSNNSDSDPIPPESSFYSYDLQREVLRDRQGSDNFNAFRDDPLAAIARMMPGFRGARGADDDSEPALEGVEEAIEELRGAVQNNDGGHARSGLIGRIMSMMGLGGDYSYASGDSPEDGEPESATDESLIAGEETDQELPDLV